MAEFSVRDGMALSVFRDKYARKKEDGTYQTWTERVDEMCDGNLSLAPGYDDNAAREFKRLAKAGVIPLSGRHLQHGDLTQSGRQAEYFYNCSTAMFSWASFLLLMKGCGVGRDYSSDMCFVDWDYLPECRFVLSGPDHLGKGGHKDYEPWIETVEEARHKYGTESEGVRWFSVEDSAEGWAKILLVLETAAFHKHNRDTIFVFDFSNVRPNGEPVHSQQGRPASGPVPLIKALQCVMSVRGAGMKPWKQALFVDHYMAACVVVGGVRRAARIACKSCYDRDVIEFIDVKRGGYLWSANNTICVDSHFWEKANDPRPSHERRVFEAAAASSYWDDTGEPGFLNVDKLNDYREGLEEITVDTYLSQSFIDRIGGIHPRSRDMIDYHLQRALKRKYPYIVNPCGEIALAAWGGYCDVGDVCLANAKDEFDAIAAAALTADALVRVNTMDNIYAAETRRTNRIGVSITGIHEFAWRQLGLVFWDLLDANRPFADKFWNIIRDMRHAAEKSADLESDRLGLNHPATYTCVKPSGTVSKVLSCTEGAHLPAHGYYIRWVAFQKSDPKILDFENLGYPTKDVSHQYADTVVVGFPTCLPLIKEVPSGVLITAADAAPVDQYEWIRLIEDNWLGPNKHNNQVSYTLKWKKSVTSYEEYMQILLQYQSSVRCCALMPELEQDESAYAYVPEEPITEDEYHSLMVQISSASEEAYDSEMLACEGGVCPIEENIR